MKNINKLIIFIFLLFSFAINAQTDEARKITEVLCSDSLFGRGYVKDGVGKAGRFLANEFKKAGLSPFIDGDFKQPFSFDVNTFPGAMEISIGGKNLTPGEDYHVMSMSGSYKGFLTYTTLDSTDLVNDEKIKSIISKIEQKSINGLVLDLRGLTAKTEMEFQNKFAAFGNYVTTIITSSQKLMWSVSRYQLKYPVILIKEERFNPFKITVNIEAKLIENYTSNNIVGFLPAKKETNKTVVFSAHYDHLGGMGTKAFFPGANDNASGTTMLVSLANYFKENPSKYNLLFIAFAGEEAGLLGSEYFVNSDVIDLKDIRFVLNLDIMGSGEDGITVVNGTTLKKDFKKLEKINAEKEYLTNVKARGETQNSDHYHFYKNGVPAFFIYTMGLNQNYHDIYDTYEELSFSAYDNIICLLIDFVEQL